jgi:hypothetical protein
MMRRFVLRSVALVAAFVAGLAAAQLTSLFRATVNWKMAEGRAVVITPNAPSVLAAPRDEPDVEWEPPQSPPPVARILETGDFHHEEVRARTGERWLGLYVTDKGSFLADSVLTVAAVKDDVVDDVKSSRKTGKRVSVNRREQPVVLAKGASTLRPGPVSTVFNGRMSLTNAASLDLRLGPTSYGLSVATKNTEYSFAIDRNDAKLILSRDSENEQVLYDLGGTGQPIEGYWELLWAGDMDGDNKLDLYVQVGWHYNSTQRKLFLSSYARKGKLVSEVGELYTVGC